MPQLMFHHTSHITHHTSHISTNKTGTILVRVYAVHFLQNYRQTQSFMLTCTHMPDGKPTSKHGLCLVPETTSCQWTERASKMSL